MSENSSVADPSIMTSQEPGITNDIKAAAGEQESLQDKIKKQDEDPRVTSVGDAIMSENSSVADPSITASQEPGIKDIKAAVGEQESLQDKIKKLKEELQMQTEEKENYKNRLQAAEKEVTDLKVALALQRSRREDDESDDTLLEKLREDNSGLREALNKAAELIQDKTNLCLSQERQNTALTSQVASLKEVVNITKDLLNIRNMEVHHLQKDVDSMEEKIKMERERQSAMVLKMDEAVRLNAELKSEYENQLRIFVDLKARYEEKMFLLEEEKLKNEIAAAKNKNINNDENDCNENKPNEEEESTPTEEEKENKPEDSEALIMSDKSNDRKVVKRSDSTNSDEFVDAHEEIAGN